METNDSPKPRLLLCLIFVGCFSFLLYGLIGRWEEMDTDEKWVRGLELMFIAVGAWVVVAPEYFPPWRSSKRPSNPREAGVHLEESCPPNQE